MYNINEHSEGINNTAQLYSGDCDTYCEVDICQTSCQRNCQGACQKSCQNCLGACEGTCEKSCQCSAEGCQTTCEKSCQCSSEDCMTCQSYCETEICQTPCETSCQGLCQKNCQDCLGASCQTCQDCQGIACQTCECKDQGCQNCLGSICQICQNNLGCDSCESGGEDCYICQFACERVCQCSKQGCQDYCEKYCQCAYEGCMQLCESQCETTSENSVVEYEPEYIHYGSPGTNPGTGNYSETFIDMSIESPGFKLNISRTYNSKDARDFLAFGRGWTFGFEGYVKGDSSVSVRLPNGGSFMFNRNGDGTYTPTDSRNKLERAADGTYTLTTKDQYKYRFNSLGYLMSMSDRNNNTITIEVNSTGKVIGIKDSASEHYTIVYNEDGLIESITEDTTKRKVMYEYRDKQLVKVTDPMGYYMTFVYDSFGFLIEIKDQKEITISKMEYDHSSSDNMHKLIKFTDSFGNVKRYEYSTTENKTIIVDSNGRRTTMWTDSNNYVIKTQDPEDRVTTTEYYLFNNINKFGEEKIHIDRYGNKTEYVRDGVGNITKIIYPDLSYKEFKYDEKNNKILEVDEIGNRIEYIYDINKINLIKKVQPLNGKDIYSENADQSLFAITKYEYYTDAEAQQLGYKAKGLLKSVTDPEGNTTIYTYDTDGNIRTIKDPETQRDESFEYNSMGLKTSETTARGHRTEYIYDNNKQLQKIVQKSTNNETTVINYDHMGRKTKEISPNLYNPSEDLGVNNYIGNYGHRYEYYPSGLLWKETDAENNTTIFNYDIYGNKTRETRPDGGIFEYEYDVLNRLKKIFFKESAEAPLTLLEEFFYEILPDKKTQTTYREYFTPTEYADTKQVYDYAGRLVLTINPDGTTLSTKYNPNGTINNTVDENGMTTYFKYDGLNRLTEKWVPVEEISGVTKYSYSKIDYYRNGNKRSEWVSPDKVDLNVVPTNFIVTSYEYYKNGKLKRQTDTAGRITEYWYDDDLNVSKVESKIDETKKQVIQYINNYLGLPEKKTVYIKAGNIYGNDFNSTVLTTLTTTYTYDKNKNLKTEKAPDDVVTTYEYDKMNRRTKVSEPGIDEFGTAVTIVKETKYNFEDKVIEAIDPRGKATVYEYDKRGFLVKIKDPEGGITAYAYDLQGRKIHEVMPNCYDINKTIHQMSRTVYKYDSMDRVITKTEIFNEKKYNPVNSTWSTSPVSVVTKAYKYDKKGHVIKELDAIGYDTAVGATVEEKINNGYGVEYKYNLAGNITEILDPVTKEKGIAFTTKNEYDALSRKVKETDAKGRIKKLEYDAAGNIKAVKHQDSLTSPEIILESKTYDLHGNVLTKTDGNGNTVILEYNEIDKLRKETYPSDETIGVYYVTYQYDSNGNLKSSIDSHLKQEIYTYDNEGRMLTKTQRKADGTEEIIVSIKYDAAGNPRFEKDGNGNITEKIYDGLNRIKAVIKKVKSINNQETVHTNNFNYDKNGNKTEEIDWRGNKTIFVYDDNNRLIEKIDPYMKSIEKLEYNKNDAQVRAYDALNNKTEFEYDKNNRIIKTTDPELHTTEQSFDEVGNLKTKKDGRGNITTYIYDTLNRLQTVLNAKNETTSYTYDTVGNVLTEKDGKGNITTFEYGVRNQLKRRIDHGGKIPNGAAFTYVDSKVESYTYFEDGKVKTIKDRNGVITSFNYDIHGRLKTKTAGTISVSYTYDNNGNILTATDITGVTTRRYDELNRIIEKYVPDIGKSVYEYDIISGVDIGEIAEKVTDPKGNISLNIYDKVGRLKKVTAEGRTTTYEYFDNGNKKAVQYQDGSSEEFTYYKDNLLKTLVNKKSD
ncbi:hypothetical protein Q428_13665, partial [Fervidicella metallireducens AeB]